MILARLFSIPQTLTRHEKATNKNTLLLYSIKKTTLKYVEIK